MLTSTPYNPLLANSNASNSTSASSIVNSAVPNGAALSNSASQMTQQLLNGMPATSKAREANAYFGGASGMPGAEFIRNRGFDLYGREADANKQQGFQNFLALISGLTGPQLQQNAQSNQSSQFAQSLAQHRQEFADSLAQRQEEFNRSNDLALQQFGFNRDRYYSSLPRRSNRGAISQVPNSVPGAPEANYNITQRNNANPEWWN